MTDAMIERAAEVLFHLDFGPDSHWPPPSGIGSNSFVPQPQGYRSAARTALDAALPVVDTVEALDALAERTMVLDYQSGVLWHHIEDEYGNGWYWTDGSVTRDSFTLLAVAGNHLRVIWTPEVTP